jgi:SH3 domain-containing YSC84-like protein 1
MGVAPGVCPSTGEKISRNQPQYRNVKQSDMKKFVLFLTTAALFAADADDRRLTASAEIFRDVMGISDKAIPQDLLEKAECAVIVPGLKKGAFIVGGKFGRGFLICRNSNRIGWGSPGAIRVEGGSIGFQIGGAETDVIMLVMNRRGADRLLSSKFTLGGEASVAAGPVGRDSQAQTDASMRAEMLSWSRQRGVFAGVALQGATLREDLDVNRELYGKTLTNREVVEKTPPAPKAAAALIEELNRYSSRK